MRSAILAQIVRDDRMHLLADLSGEVAHLLAHQVPAEVFGDLAGKVVHLVKSRVGELLPADVPSRASRTIAAFAHIVVVELFVVLAVVHAVAVAAAPSAVAIPAAAAVAVGAVAALAHRTALLAELLDALHELAHVFERFRCVLLHLHRGILRDLNHVTHSYLSFCLREPAPVLNALASMSWMLHSVDSTPEILLSSAPIFSSCSFSLASWGLSEHFIASHASSTT